MYNNEINNNSIGIALKDSSNAILVKNRFEDNFQVILAYRKKQIYDFPVGFLSKNKVLNFKDEHAYFTDTYSKLYNIDSFDLDEEVFENYKMILPTLDKIKKELHSFKLIQ